jgi:hypothetical protein
MDSQFKVNITADISDLQNRLKAVEVELQKLSKATDGVSGSMKNMEQNANRGRMVAFAFGQVIRDAGFFSQSFSLGILAISNNIPILIDQLALSIKVLQPFAGTLSLIGSLLTAGLTVWAYSTQAVKKYSDEINKAKGAAMASGAELKSLLAIARDESLSIQQRQDAINRLNEGYSDYNNELTIANVNSKKNIKRSEDMASVMLLEAEAAAIAAQAQMIYSKSLAIKNLPPEELGGFWETLGYSISKAMKMDMGKPIENILKLSGSLSQNLMGLGKITRNIYNNFSGARQEVANLNEQAKNNQISQLDKEAKSFEDRLKQINLEITSKLLTGGKTKAKDSILQTLKETLTSIELDPSLSKLEKVKESISANQAALKSLVDENVNRASPAFKKVVGDLKSLSDEYKKLEASAKAVKEQEELLNALDKVAQNLESRRIDIAESFDLRGSQKIKQEIEAISDAIRQFEALGKENPALAQFTGLKTVIALLRIELEKLGVAFDNSIKSEKAAQELDQLRASYEQILYSGLAQAIGDMFYGMGDAIANGTNVAKGAAAGFLGAVSTVLEGLAATAIKTGILTIGIGKAIESINVALKSLKGIGAILAGAALIAVAGAARAGARNIAGGGSGSTSAAAPPSGFAFGGLNTSASTSMNNSAAIAANAQPVLETRVSGNDLVILMNRSSNARNNYY